MTQYTYILGFIPAVLFFAMLSFATLGIVMSLLIDSQKRDQNSTSTPEKFSYKFLIKDNWKSIAFTILAVILTLRFAPWFFPDQFSQEALNIIGGSEKWLLGSLFIGLGYNQLLQIWKSKATFLKVERKEIK